MPCEIGRRLAAIRFCDHAAVVWIDQPSGCWRIPQLSYAVGVAQARGAILNVLEECGVPVFEYKPSQVKVILTGYGNADKSQIGRMLAAQVKMPEGKIDDHARDAIAIALCHARSRRFARAATS